MIIVSQDKKKITDRMELWVDLAINTYYGVFCINVRGEDTCLGIYETEERAKKVLQEIVNRNATYELYKTAPSGGKEQTEMLDMFAQKKYILDSYEMPEK